jgi:hypothetical protein
MNSNGREPIPYFRKHIGVTRGFLMLCCIASVATGCDHTKTVSQQIVLVVRSRPDYVPARVEVALKRDVTPSATDLRREQLNPGRFEALYPWTAFVRSADAGKVKFMLSETTLVDPSNKVPPKSQWPVPGEGERFILRIRDENGDIHTLDVEMAEGSIADNDAFSVEILEIADAFYVGEI